MKTPTDHQQLLRQAITASGWSIRQFAVDVLVRDERTVRRWLGGDPMPLVVVRFLASYLRTGE